LVESTAGVWECVMVATKVAMTDWMKVVWSGR
jgi:hypothetical protein